MCRCVLYQPTDLTWQYGVPPVLSELDANRQLGTIHLTFVGLAVVVVYFKNIPANNFDGENHVCAWITKIVFIKKIYLHTFSRIVNSAAAKKFS